MSNYQMKPGKVGQKVIDAYEKIEDKFTQKFLNEDGSLKTGGVGEKVTAAYQKVEDGVVGAYQKVEDSVVGGYKKIENAFVEKFLEEKENPSDKT